MDILADVWDKWATKESIIKAAKRVGISNHGLNWQWMQLEKFAQTEALIESDVSEVPSSSKPVWQADPPAGIRSGTKEYWKSMYEAQLEISRKQAQLPVSPEAVGIVNVEKIKRVKRKITRVTQVHGSMEGQHILERIEELSKEKEKNKAAKEERKKKKTENTETFIRCEKSCVCGEAVCMAKGLRQCSQCKDVFKSSSKSAKSKCKINGVQMKSAFFDRKKEILRVADVYTESESD